MQGAASSHTVGDAQTNHDNQLRWQDDPFAQLGSCMQENNHQRKSLSRMGTAAPQSRTPQQLMGMSMWASAQQIVLT